MTLSSFFVAGGTVPPGSPSYVERAADRELFEALLAGEHSYVLNSRQMGKSSLAVQTVEKLHRAGVRTAFVDLTRIGGATVTAEQWYAGLLLETGRALGLRAEAAAWFRAHPELGAAQRYLSFLQEAALPAAETPLVVMLDEIDAVRSLGFATDELFAGIRQLHNGRASEPALSRLTFCLLGAALPSDLIQDPRSTPFNVGRRIELRDFSPDEARPFAAALGPDGEALLRRVVSWTGGHPFLTQALCADLAEGAEPGAEPATRVDALVRRRYLDAQARESDTNLADVGRRLLGEGDPDVDDQARANTLSQYATLLKRGIPNDESNPACARVKMSGVARLDGGRLTIRNRIYAEVFGPAWIRENMPGQELRRQRRAYWLGVLRTAAVAAAVVATVGYLAWNNARLRRVADDRRREAEYQTYVASMRMLPLALQDGNLEEINQTLASLKANPARGWEWNYWYHVANPGDASIPVADYGFNDEFTPDGRYLMGTNWAGDRIAFLDMRAYRIARTIPVRPPVAGPISAFLAREGGVVVVVAPKGWLISVDAATGREIVRRRFSGLSLGERPHLGTREIVGILDSRPVAIDAETLEARPLPAPPLAFRGNLEVSPDGRYMAWFEVTKSGAAMLDVVVVRVADGKEIDRTPMPRVFAALRFAPDSRYLAIGLAGGHVALRDVLRHRAKDYAPLTDSVAYVGFSPDGRSLLVCGDARRGALLDLTSGRVERRFLDAEQANFTPSGSRIYTVYATMRIYDAASNPETTVVSPPSDWQEAALTSQGTVSYWHPNENVVLDLLHESARPQTTPLNATVAIANPIGRVWTRVTRKPSMLEVGRLGSQTADLRFSLPSGGVLTFDVSPDGRLFAYRNAVYRLAPSSNPKPVAVLPTLGAPIHMAFSDDGRSLFVGDDTGALARWDVGSWRKPVWTYRAATFPCLCGFVRSSPDGKRLAAPLTGDQAVVLDAATGAEIARLRGHSQTVNCVAWSPDGRRVATGANDGTVRLWDSQTGAQLGIIGRHEGGVLDVRFLPGGRTLASLGRDQAVRLWKTESRR